MLPLALHGREYRLALTFVRVYGERLHWPHRTKTGLCFGAFGIHAKCKVTVNFKEFHGTRTTNP